MVFLSISYAGVEMHIAGIHENLRYIVELRELLQKLGKESDDVVYIETLHKCTEVVRIVEISTRKRIRFLNEVVDSVQRMEGIDGINRGKDDPI